MKVSTEAERGRVRTMPEFYSESGDLFGLFVVLGPCGRMLRIIASSGDRELGVAWEHVSVSLPKHTPNWAEMCYVKAQFWDDEETVMQLHPPQSKWINNHPHCLHLWRPLDVEIPLPPSETVGDRNLGVLF